MKNKMVKIVKKLSNGVKYNRFIEQIVEKDIDFK